jgi:hypothetical protein
MSTRLGVSADLDSLPWWQVNNDNPTNT